VILIGFGLAYFL